MAGAMFHGDYAGWLLSGQKANGTGAAFDFRGAIDFAICEVKCTANSAIVDVLYSPQGTDWATGITVTATNGGTSLFQVSAYWPFVAAGARGIYSAAGGSATAYVYYRPGMSV